MDHSAKPLVSIVIPTSGTSPTLFRCLRACNRLLGKLHAEVILVFDLYASHHTVENIKKEFPHYRLFFSDSPGATFARNLGLKNVAGQFFFLIDDDCVLGDADWVRTICARAEKTQILHGGTYQINPDSSYWAKVYNWVNACWLSFGRHEEGYQEHLLGGFLFGCSSISSYMVFNSEMPWGGEEKELLTRLRSNFNIKALLHEDLSIEHYDQTGVRKFIKRAFLQGKAAGRYNLQSTRFRKPPGISSGLIPGLILFYCFSRTGIFIGKVFKTKMGAVKIAESSPIA